MELSTSPKAPMSSALKLTPESPRDQLLQLLQDAGLSSISPGLPQQELLLASRTSSGKALECLREIKDSFTTRKFLRHKREPESSEILPSSLSQPHPSAYTVVLP